MIVDVHTHFLEAEKALGEQVRADLARCGIDPALWTFTPDDHLEGTAAADLVVVFGMQAAATGWHGDNDAVVEHVRRDPARLIFFASIDPGVEGYIDELRRCHGELGCRGVKLGPIYQGVHPHDKRYYAIYEYCQRYALPVITHMATTFSSGVPLEYARPVHIDRVAIEFPELKIVLAHLGHPWEAETIAVIRKQPNVFADLSALYYRPWQFYHAMRLVTEYGASGKLLFGSDFPATTTADSIAGLRNVNALLGASGLPAVPEDILEEILHRDALELLGLEHPGTGGVA